MVAHPLKGATLDDAKKFKWPNPRDQARLEGIKEESSRLAKSDCFVVLGTVGMTVGLLQTFQWLLGFEDSFYALAAEPELTHYIVGKLSRNTGFIDRNRKKMTGIFIY